MLTRIFGRNKKADTKKEMVSFYGQFVPNGGLVFDIGANIGNRIEIFLEIGATVIAVEPQPACVAVLKEKFGNKISIEQTGLSSSEGMLEFHIADEPTISSFSKEFISKTGVDRFKRNKWKETISVPVTTFDKLIEKYGVPDFSKIDVEGFESEVLKGLTSKVPVISFEYCVPEMTANLASCVQKLNTLDPSALFNYSIGESFKLELNEWRTFSDFSPLLNEKSFHKTLFGDIYTKLSR